MISSNFDAVFQTIVNIIMIDNVISNPTNRIR